MTKFVKILEKIIDRWIPLVFPLILLFLYGYETTIICFCVYWIFRLTILFEIKSFTQGVLEQYFSDKIKE